MKAPDISADRLHIRDLAPGLSNLLWLGGLVALVAGLLLATASGTETFLRAYLTGFMFTLSLALGALFFVLLQHATRAGWSVVVRRIAEYFTCGFGILAVLSLPIIIAMVLQPDILGIRAAIHDIFPWTSELIVWGDNTAAHPGDEILQGKSGFLSTPFFVLRMVAYFGIWLWLSHFFLSRSLQQDQSGDPQLSLQMQTRSYPGMILFALSLSFVAIDLLMSLDPHWFSTIFGVYYFGGSALGFFSLLAVTMFWLQSNGRMSQAITVEHYHDVGKLAFAFIVFWAYIAFSQYMLIWYGNLPEETAWLTVRQSPTWAPVSLLLLFGHFVIPFLALISRVPKRGRYGLVAAALWILVMHLCDMIWLVFPHVNHGGDHAIASFGVLDVIQIVLCTLGILGLYLGRVVRASAQGSLLPERDPRLPESLAFHNF